MNRAAAAAAYPDPSSSEQDITNPVPFYTRNGAIHDLQPDLNAFALPANMQRHGHNPRAQAQHAMVEDGDEDDEEDYNMQRQANAAQVELDGQHDHQHSQQQTLQPSPNQKQQQPQHQNPQQQQRRQQQQQQQEHDHTAIAQHAMNLNPSQHPDTDAEDASLKAKRSKVSRACDECRRKKVRCDASDADPPALCSNCKRTGAQCRFSRTPMKRGPSKGYIKELADKINTLETRLGPAFGGSLQDHGFEVPYAADFSIPDGLETRNDYPQHQMDVTRKRTHSMSDRGILPFMDSPFMPLSRGQGTGWNDSTSRPAMATVQSSDTGAIQAQSTEAGLRASQLSPRDGSAWRWPGREQADKESAGDLPEAQKDAGSSLPLDWEEVLFDEYYHNIHPTFPILPDSKQDSKARLASCPHIFQQAFMAALECCVHSSSTMRPTINANLDLNEMIKRTAILIAESQYDSSTMLERTLSMDLTYLQTLVFMALTAETLGPNSVVDGGRTLAPSVAEWLGRAIGFATYLRLDVSQNRPIDVEGQDGDEHLGRRIMWTIFVLDRWHACSTSTLPQLPDSRFRLMLEDQWLLGPTTYQIARLSFILGHLSLIFSEAATAGSASKWAGSILSTAIIGEMDRLRESIETTLLNPPGLVHLFYWHVQMLIDRATLSASAHDLLVSASRTVDALADNNNSSGTSDGAMSTPLRPHLIGLAVLTLTELTRFEYLRKQAEQAIDKMLQILGPHRGGGVLDDNVEEQERPTTGWDDVMREQILAYQTRRDAAVASAEAGQQADELHDVGHGQDVERQDQSQSQGLQQPPSKRRRLTSDAGDTGEGVETEPDRDGSNRSTGNLRHLADAATGMPGGTRAGEGERSTAAFDAADEPSGERVEEAPGLFRSVGQDLLRGLGDVGFDFSKAVRRGYLTALLSTFDL